MQAASMSGNKRSSDQSGAPQPKRRAAQACQTCRSRKVRCDIVIHGSPCTNCRLDKSNCVVMASRRGPKPGRTQRQPVDTSPQCEGDNDEEPQQPERQHQQQLTSPISCVSQQPPESVHEVALGLTFDCEDDDAGHDLSCGPGTASPAQTKAVDSLCLPDFVRPLPESLTEDDLAYLAKKGAFTVPGPALRAEILRCYISEVHPFMPILDIKHFCDAITSNGESGRVSLHLFQAVMFAGLSTLSPETLQAHAYENAKHGRRLFFERVRLLHELVDEPDSLALLQTLLLMSFWYGGRSDRKNTWHYSGLAWSLAQSQGLHREPDTSLPDASMRRRLWWSLYIRDRLISLATRRPMRIRDEDFAVAMLSTSDFDSQDHVIDLQPQDSHSDACLPLMCIELAKLCVLIGRVLTSHYSTLGRRSLWTKALMVVPRQDIDDATMTSKLAVHQEEIADWYQSLHPNVRRVSLLRMDEPRGMSSSVQRHWFIVDMIRLTLISLLYRPSSLLPLPSTASTINGNNHSAQLIMSSRKKLKAAACSLTKIAHAMFINGEARFLTTSGIPCLLSASLTHLLDVDSADDDVRDASIFRLLQIMQVFQCLREVYASADSAVAFLGKVIQKTRINHRHPEIAAMAPEFTAVDSSRVTDAASTTTSRPSISRSLSTPVVQTSSSSGPAWHNTDLMPSNRSSQSHIPDFGRTVVGTSNSDQMLAGNTAAFQHDYHLMTRADGPTYPLMDGTLGNAMTGHHSSEDILGFFGSGSLFEPLGSLDYDLDTFDFF